MASVRFKSADHLMHFPILPSRPDPGTAVYETFTTTTECMTCTRRSRWSTLPSVANEAVHLDVKTKATAKPKCTPGQVVAHVCQDLLAVTVVNVSHAV